MQAPALDRLLAQALEGVGRPAAFVLAGHNGSGKSTLWDSRLSPMLHMPLINADRLTLSILPQPGADGKLPAWAQSLRDDDERWQILSQRGVRAYKSLVMEEAIPFAFETVFSHWKPRAEGGYESKADDIVEMQAKGYFVVLIFVGLIGPDISVLRVATRRQQGGHDVERGKLLARFPRTQAAVAHAAPVADMTLMFDNSLGAKKAFTLVRAQRKAHVLFDARDPRYAVDPEVIAVSGPWLSKVAGAFPATPGQMPTKRRAARRR